MSLPEASLPFAESGDGPPCPRCGSRLALVVERDSVEFYCPQGHSVGTSKVLSGEAASARRVLEEALRQWEACEAEISHLAREAEAAGVDGAVSLCRRRLDLIAERVRALRSAMGRLA